VIWKLRELGQDSVLCKDFNFQGWELRQLENFLLEIIVDKKVMILKKEYNTREN
jgi:hypothetical protein